MALKQFHALPAPAQLLFLRLDHVHGAPHVREPLVLLEVLLEDLAHFLDALRDVHADARAELVTPRDALDFMTSASCHSDVSLQLFEVFFGRPV